MNETPDGSLEKKVGARYNNYISLGKDQHWGRLGRVRRTPWGKSVYDLPGRPHPKSEASQRRSREL